jgi:hypothetical protein
MVKIQTKLLPNTKHKSAVLSAIPTCLVLCASRKVLGEELHRTAFQDQLMIDAVAEIQTAFPECLLEALRLEPT